MRQGTGRPRACSRRLWRQGTEVDADALDAAFRRPMARRSRHRHSLASLCGSSPSRGFLHPTARPLSQRSTCETLVTPRPRRPPRAPPPCPRHRPGRPSTRTRRTRRGRRRRGSVDTVAAGTVDPTEAPAVKGLGGSGVAPAAAAAETASIRRGAVRAASWGERWQLRWRRWWRWWWWRRWSSRRQRQQRQQQPCRRAWPNSPTAAPPRRGQATPSPWTPRAAAPPFRKGCPPFTSWDTRDPPPAPTARPPLRPPAPCGRPAPPLHHPGWGGLRPRRGRPKTRRRP